MKRRMLRGELYIADDPDLATDFARAQELGVPARVLREIGDRDRVDVPDILAS
jgi:hypothetical protein